jgi:hypothetical protein
MDICNESLGWRKEKDEHYGSILFGEKRNKLHLLRSEE